MPDFTVDTTLTTPPEIVQQPLPDNYNDGKGAPAATDPFSKFVADGNKNLPAWMSPKALRMQDAFKTRIDQTLRYTDPNLGFSPTNANIEDDYANAHPFKTLGNNLLQTGARFLGAATEAIATIPLALNAAINQDFSKLYDNDLTNGIDGWLKSLDNTLPVFQTNYERDHPVMKYLNPLKLTSFTGAIGGAVNNLGFMAGAIAGSLVEDAAITFLTGGAGLFPAVAGNAALITKLSRASRALVAEPTEALSIIKSAARTAEETLPAISRSDALMEAGAGTNIVRSTGENVSGTGLQAEDVLASAKTKDIKAAINSNANYYKIRDAVKYNLALLSSGMSIGAFQAVDVYNKGVDQLSQRYFDLNGKAPQGEDLQQIVRTSKESANIAMGANVALTYLTGRLNFGSLFKPSTQAFDEAITGFGKSIATQKVERTAIDEAGNFKYNLITKTPETTIGKILLNSRQIGNKTAVASIEGLQFGAMGAITESSMDYNLRKYDAQNRGEVVNYIQSFLKGIDNSFATDQGFANVMMGFVVGAFGSPLLHKVMAGRGQLSPKEQMQRNVDLLNSSTLKGTMEHQMQEAAVQTSLATEHKEAVENQDKLSAKNIKFEMLYNWVTSGIKANSYRARVEELDAVRNLTGKSFESYWGREDNEQNRQQVHEYLDNFKKKADNINDIYTKIDRLTKNPYDPKKAQQDYQAFDAYKDQLALNLSKSEDYQARLQAVKETLTRLSPGLDVQNAVDLTSVDGLRNILRKLDKSSKTLTKQIKTATEAGTDSQTISEMEQKHKHLSSLFSELQPLVTGKETDLGGNVLNNELDGKKFVDILQKLYKLHTGADFTANAYLDEQRRITDGNTIHLQDVDKVKDSDTLADALQNLQDVYKLSEANLNVQRYYNYLRQGKGATEYMNLLKSHALANLQKFTGNDGEIKTPQQLQEEIEEDTRFDFGEPADVEEATKPERDAIRKAAKKTVAGQKLTAEEQHLSETKPSRFANEVKIQNSVKQKVEERFGTPSQNKNDGDPIAENTQRGVKLTDVFGMFSQDKNTVPFRTNLYKAIFKSGVNNVFNNLTATFETVDPTEASTKNIPNTGLYRSTFNENIKILHNGEQIGILRPADSLWLDNNKTRSVYYMSADEYQAATGNDPSTYKAFMDGLRGYQESYNNLKEEMIANPDKQFTYADINRHFDLQINTGSSAQNRFTIQKIGNKFNVLDPNGKTVKTTNTTEDANNWIVSNNNKLSRFDTLLKDLNYKPEGTALISFTDVVTGGKGGQISSKSTEAVVANRDELTPAQQAKLDVFLEQHKDFLRDNVHRYAILAPINGEYQKKSILFARNADTTTEDRTDYFNQIKNVASGSIPPDQLADTIKTINDKYFIANNDRTIKQTFITTKFDKDGNLILSINNPSLKVFKDITIPKADVQNTKTYGDLMQKLQSQVNNESQKDNGLNKLSVDLTEDSLKRQIPNDSKITKLSQVEDVLKVATTPDVFKNYNINFHPKTSEAPVKGTEPQPPVESTKNYITDRLKNETVKPSEPEQIKNIPLADITLDPTVRSKVEQRLNSGTKTTQDDEPITLKYNEDGSLEILDGAHRFIQAERDGKKSINASVINVEQDSETFKPAEVYQAAKIEAARRLQLSKDFNADLTLKEKAIKDVITQDKTLANNTAALLKASEATMADLQSYIQKATKYNNDIKGIKVEPVKAEEPSEGTETVKEIYQKLKIENIQRRQSNNKSLKSKGPSIFFEVNGEPHREYGEHLFKALVDENAKLEEAKSSLDFIRDNNLMDTPTPFNVLKPKDYKQLDTTLEKFKEKYPTLGSLVEAAENGEFSSYWIFTQQGIENHLKGKFDGIVFTEEDYVSGPQVQIWNREIIKDIQKIHQEENEADNIKLGSMKSFSYDENNNRTTSITYTVNEEKPHKTSHFDTEKEARDYVQSLNKPFRDLLESEDIEKSLLQKVLDADIPKGISPEYLRNGLNEAIKNGDFAEAIRNGQVSPEKAKEILKYFNVKESKFADDFAAVEKQNADTLIQQNKNEQPLNAEELDFINTLKANVGDLKGAAAASIKELINTEDYRSILDYAKGQLVDDTKQAKTFFNNDETYKAFKKLTGAEDNTSNVDQFFPDIHTDEPEPQQEAAKYITYTEAGPDDTIVQRHGKVLNEEGILSTIEDARGNQVTRLTSSLRDATKEQFDSQKTQVPDAKYIVGDKVTYGADKKQFTIIDSEQRIKENGKDFDTFYNTEEGVLINENGIHGLARQNAATKEFKIRAEHQTRYNTLKRISGRFEQLFPQIKAEIGYYDFNAPARFNKGRVEINIGFEDKRYTQAEINMFNTADPNNTPWLKRESVAHEFMHPFIVALRDSNSALYDSLTKEIQGNKAIMDKVDKLIKAGTYHEAERTNEALAIYLGKEITKAFNKDGTLNPDYVTERKNSLAKRFFQWLQDIFDYLTGKKKIATLGEFVKNANADSETVRKNIRTQFKDVAPLEDLHTKHYGSDVTKTIAFIKRTLGDAINKDGSINEDKYEAGIQYLNEKLGGEIDTIKLSSIIDTISDFIQKKPNGRFEFIERINENDGVEFDESNLDHIKVYVDPTFADQISAPSVMQQYGARLTDNKAAEEFKNLVQRSYYKTGSFVEKDNEIGVKSFNPLMRLQDVSDYVVKGLADQDTQIKYDSNELKSIDELTAYMDLTKDESAKIRARIVARLKQLKDTADVRLNNDILKTNYNVINRLNLDETDTDFVLKYIQQGAVSINLAWRKFNELREDLKDPTLTKAKLNRLNKELDVIKQLTSFYDDFSSLYNRYDEEFETDEIAKFNKATANLQRLRDDMQETSINLATKWFMPYVEKHNEFIVKEGYTDPKYQLTEKQLKDNFRYGTAKDTNFITFNLGATVTSRDPVNAIFSNIVADMLSVNNVHIVNDSFDINEGYARFLALKGISNNDNKAQEKFYKENYLRQADILTSYYDEATGSYTDKYIQKAALHQEFFFDKYDRDLAIEKAKYANPRSSEEAQQFEEKLNAWRKERNNGKAEQYRNKAYDGLKNDPYFKLLEKHYNNANVKYGEFQLQYGIIPQVYDRNIVQHLKDIVQGTNTHKTIGEKATFLADKARLALAGLKKDQTKINLDDTVYRSVNSNLNKLKDDKNIDFNLHRTIIDFVTEATNYGSLKEVQYNAENLRMLIEGNTKFSIPSRKIGKEDFEAKIRQPIQLRKAKERLAELQSLKDKGETYDEALYNKLTDKVAKGIQPGSLWDKFAGTIKPSETGRLNEQLRQFINDTFYGESVEEVKLGEISLNKAAHYLSMYTSINNMAFNTVAGVSNVVVGDVQMLIEGQGGKYYNKAELAKAVGDYIKNIPNYMSDLSNPIKSKDTQLSFILDAIQGEVLDEFGNRISGNIARRMFNPSSLFLFTSLGEHQIQITGMKAMLLGKKVETTGGQKITLYDAYVKDSNGRYSLRKDLKDFNEDDLQHFIRQLHSVNRSLNGNYSALHKGTLQRKWYGTLALKFRKYIYESFRTRYASEHTDYEKNTVDVGYLRYFFKDYLYANFKKLALRQATNFKGENLKPNEKYALRKATMEIGIYAGITILTSAMFGGKAKKELSSVEKAMLLYSLRLRNDLGMYHASLFSELKQQSQNPTASLTTIIALTKTLGQLMHPTETYAVNSNGHKKGDSKLAADTRKLIPILSKFPINLDNKLSYFNMVNQNVEGVARNPNAN